jgi:serine/threonine protein phosphatase PrpC
MNPCFLLENSEQTPLAGGTRVEVPHRRREETWRLPVRPLETVLHGRMCRYVRQAPAQPPLGRGAERLLRLSIVQQGDLMVVANVGDSRVVLGIAFDDDAITSSSSSST